MTDGADPPVTGLRGALRATFYQAHKYDLGCPTESQCDLYARTQEAACASCPKHLTPVEVMDPVWANQRIRFLFRLESLITVGCTFHASDLPPRVWDELVLLKMERTRIDGLVLAQKSAVTAQQRETEKAKASARKQSNIPAPGQSIFGASGRRRR